MSTNCMIGEEYGDKIKAIYCHFDGYPSYMGPLLKDYYNTSASVNALINLGSLSYLDKYLKPKEGVEHSFDHPAKDVTVAYHRDRGEDLQIQVYSDEQAYKKDTKEDAWFDYVYLFKNGEWYVLDEDENIPVRERKFILL